MDPHRDWLGRVEMWSRLVSHPHPMWWIRIYRDILVAEVLSKEQGVPTLYQGPQPRVLLPRREITITSDYKIQQGSRLREMEGTRAPGNSSLRVHTQTY